jgi:hypothetical protein
MDQEVITALSDGGIADITTIGRKTGLPRRIEIVFHHFDGDLYLTGRPGFKRDWQANIENNPEFTLHLKRGVTADVTVRGEPEPDREVRAAILLRVLVENWGTEPAKARADLDRWVDTSPFIRFRPSDPGWLA